MRAALLALLLCCACRTPAATYRVHDLTPAFWSYWDTAATQPADQQVARLEAEVIAKHPDVYTAAVIGLPADQPLHDGLTALWPKYLGFVGDALLRARTLSTELGRDLPGYDARFREAFPDFAYDGEVYFFVSLGGMDGGLREVHGRTALLFGVDIIARIYGADAKPAAFFHHELFHLYHRQFPDPALEGTLARALWMEGLAQYVAAQLNPGTSEAMLLGLPLSSPKRVRAAQKVLASAFRAKLDSKSQEDYATWFLGSGEDATPPARAGYTLGYLVVQRVAGTRTLVELARLNGPALRAEVDAALASLAK